MQRPTLAGSGQLLASAPPAAAPELGSLRPTRPNEEAVQSACRRDPSWETRLPCLGDGGLEHCRRPKELVSVKGSVKGFSLGGSQLPEPTVPAERAGSCAGICTLLPRCALPGPRPPSATQPVCLDRVTGPGARATAVAEVPACLLLMPHFRAACSTEFPGVMELLSISAAPNGNQQPQVATENWKGGECGEGTGVCITFD